MNITQIPAPYWLLLAQRFSGVLNIGNPFLLLHQRRKQTEDLLKQMYKEIAAAAFLQNGATGLQGGEKILFDIPDNGTAE